MGALKNADHVDVLVAKALAGYTKACDIEGDTLSSFIEEEIRDSYDPKATKAAQRTEAARVLERGASRLQAAAAAARSH